MITTAQKLEFIAHSPAIEVIAAMKDWGYVAVREKPDERDPNKWWAGFGKPDAGTHYGFGDTAEDAVRQAAKLAIEKEGESVLRPSESILRSAKRFNDDSTSEGGTRPPQSEHTLERSIKSLAPPPTICRGFPQG